MPKELCEKNNYFKEYLHESIKAQKSPNAMNSEKVIKEYDDLLEYINTGNINQIELIIIRCNHWLYHLDLGFRKSLFLRKFKNPDLDIKWHPIIIIICIFIICIVYIYL